LKSQGFDDMLMCSALCFVSINQKSPLDSW